MKDGVYEFVLFLVASGFLLITLTGDTLSKAGILTTIGAIVLLIKAIDARNDQ